MKVLIPIVKRKKLGPKIVDVVFNDYAKNNYAYRFLIIKLEIIGIYTNTIVKYHDTTFFKDVLPINLDNMFLFRHEPLYLSTP